MWKGGISKQEYPNTFNKILKKDIKNRDKYKCQICGLSNEDCKIKYKGELHVHHIDYNKNNIDENNLISLCAQCHIRTNQNRKKWTNYFNSIYKTPQVL